MTIYPNFSTFRTEFSRVTWVTAAFAGAGEGCRDTLPTDTMVRLAGDFVADGVLAGMSIRLLGTVANDGLHPIDSVAALLLTMNASVSFSDEDLVGTYDVAFYDPDGYPSWPVSYVRKAASGFGDTGSTLTYSGYPFATNDPVTISCNGGGSDGVKGTPEYNWYLSQRTAVLANQPLAMVQLPDTPTDSYSGSVALSLSSFWGLSPSVVVTAELRQRALKYCHLYVQRVSDGAIQWVDLSRLLGV